MIQYSTSASLQINGSTHQFLNPLHTGPSKSPCLSCRHIKDDKNYCRTLPECPIRIRTVFNPEQAALAHNRTPRQRIKDVPNKICPTTGCTNLIRETSLACQTCWPRLNHRIRAGVPEHMLFYDGKLPNNWKERWGTQDYGRKVTKLPGGNND